MGKNSEESYLFNHTVLGFLGIRDADLAFLYHGRQIGFRYRLVILPRNSRHDFGEKARREYIALHNSAGCWWTPCCLCVHLNVEGVSQSGAALVRPLATLFG